MSEDNSLRKQRLWIVHVIRASLTNHWIATYSDYQNTTNDSARQNSRIVDK